MAGLQIGVNISQANQRMDMERERMQMETQVRERQMERQMEETRTRLATQQAYHDQLISLRQQQLQGMEQKNRMATTAAASKLAAQQQYRQRVAGGEDAAKVMMELGPAMGAGAGDIGAAMRATRGAQKPTWIPADTATGAPGHFETPSGAVHIPPRVTPANNMAMINATVSELKARRKMITDEMTPREPSDPTLKARWLKQRSEVDTLNRQIEGLLPGLRALGVPTEEAAPAARTATATAPTGIRIVSIRPKGAAPVSPAAMAAAPSHEEERDLVARSHGFAVPQRTAPPVSAPTPAPPPAPTAAQQQSQRAEQIYSEWRSALAMYRAGRMSKSQVNALAKEYDKHPGAKVGRDTPQVEGPEWVVPKPPPQWLQRLGQQWVPGTGPGIEPAVPGRWQEPPGPWE